MAQTTSQVVLRNMFTDEFIVVNQNQIPFAFPFGQKTIGDTIWWKNDELPNSNKLITNQNFDIKTLIQHRINNIHQNEYLKQEPSHRSYYECIRRSNVGALVSDGHSYVWSMNDKNFEILKNNQFNFNKIQSILFPGDIPICLYYEKNFLITICNMDPFFFDPEEIQKYDNQSEWINIPKIYYQSRTTSKLIYHMLRNMGYTATNIQSHSIHMQCCIFKELNEYYKLNNVDTEYKGTNISHLKRLQQINEKIKLNEYQTNNEWQYRHGYYNMPQKITTIYKIFRNSINGRKYIACIMFPNTLNLVKLNDYTISKIKKVFIQHPISGLQKLLEQQNYFYISNDLNSHKYYKLHDYINIPLFTPDKEFQYCTEQTNKRMWKIEDLRKNDYLQKFLKHKDMDFMYLFHERLILLEYWNVFSWTYELFDYADENGILHIQFPMSDQSNKIKLRLLINAVLIINENHQTLQHTYILQIMKHIWWLTINTHNTYWAILPYLRWYQANSIEEFLEGKAETGKFYATLNKLQLSVQLDFDFHRSWALQIYNIKQKQIKYIYQAIIMKVILPPSNIFIKSKLNCLYLYGHNIEVLKNFAHICALYLFRIGMKVFRFGLSNTQDSKCNVGIQFYDPVNLQNCDVGNVFGNNL